MLLPKKNRIFVVKNIGKDLDMLDILFILLVVGCAIGYFILKTVIMVIIAIQRKFFPHSLPQPKVQKKNKSSSDINYTVYPIY